ncbi:MAG: SDR family oxidoreductase [Betaproteobacteria bacterium]|jgi:NAD(P)-dependent dehydrogenase (short-subunit alcohol dehydrogenase family)|uniref:SDR family oxidoreductase n=1 Tax=unclassified Thiomonas TaxID=2625466 RepID=UPI000BCE653C|nr:MULTISPECIES: SDR family oxidoreductase [unclassified Thiomonas]MDE2175101.1 SDR family oxidoreductase [Betaproteobacteria bacterium]OYV31037.1 MAG: short chain dehydrogenase [Thiomonas sp. 20-64-9]OZB70743.1 MAG: short chain dehydrogenase [Thiomonas sp. 13-64-67]
MPPDATTLPVTRPKVLVTGAAHRLGREIALHLAAQGWDVAVHYHRSKSAADAVCAEARALGAQAAAVGVDLFDPAAARDLLPQAVAALGRVDAVVNNAALFEFDDAQHFSVEAAQRHYQVNTIAPVLLAQALHAQLSARGAQGCVVNLLDQKLANPDPDYLSYTLSKAALQAATVALAQALAPVLRVVGVAPGLMLPSGPMTDDEFTRVHSRTPLQRGSTPQDVAQAVHFALQARAMTGATLLVDGGQHLAGTGRDVLFAARDQALR